ncbi:MAG: Hsp70 family protein [Alistipes sp.]|nr:Hsp70 family protein [Alistipes sp.]
MYYIGIDFGHGETTVSRVPGINGSIVSQIAIKQSSKSDDKKIISAICKKDNKWSLVQGEQDFRLDDLREGFKGMISLMTDSDKEAMREFAKLIFAAILKNDTSLEYIDNDNRNFKLGIACPSDWIREDPKAQQDYLDFFRNECGLPVDHCIKESDAAFFTKFRGNEYAVNDNVFVIDLGSSTIDFTTYSNSKCISNCCWGANLGAHRIEDALMPYVKSGSSASNIETLINFRNVNGFAGNIDSTISLFVRTQKEKYYTESQQSYSLAVRYDYLTPRWTGPKWEICIGFEASIEEFDKIIANYKLSIKETLRNAKIRLNTNGITPNRVLLSGGASRMPFIREYVEDVFGVHVDVDPQPECVVSNGIALYSEAFDNAFRELGSILRGVDFATIYRDADTVATAKAIERLIPSVVAQIKQDSGCTGERMRKMFCNFIRGLDENNDTFKELVSSELNATISSKAAGAISSAYKRVFKIDVDTSDVKIQVEADILPFASSNFEEGGGWYNRITEYIKKSSGCIFDGAFFTWDQARDFDERCRIADGVKSYLVSSSMNISYPNLDEIVKKIVTQAADYTIRIFKEKQLFETTFKQ